MSCRDTPGNSAITSYARLTSTAAVSDHDVQQVFHDLKRRHRETVGHAPAETGEILGFLDHHAWRVRHDNNLTPVRKNSLLERLSRARAEVAGATRTPDLATFRAWQDLTVEVEVRTQRRDLQARASDHPARTDAAERMRRRLG